MFFSIAGRMIVGDKEFSSSGHLPEGEAWVFPQGGLTTWSKLLELGADGIRPVLVEIFWGSLSPVMFFG